jgi:hypothetical protein
LSRLIPRPDLWLILDVPEDELLRRKQEVPFEELHRQREAYRRLVSELSNAIILNGSLPPEEVARQAEDAILEYMHERYLSRRGLWFPESRVEKEGRYFSEALGAHISQKGKPFFHLALPDGRGYLIPLNSHRAAVTGLSLYSPQKTKARLLKSVLTAGLCSGIARHFLPRVNLDLQELEKHLEQVFGEQNLSLAISLGASGPHRKPVVQVVSQKGEILGYVKVGWNRETRILVQNESRILQHLQEKKLSFLVPHVLLAGDWQGRFVCAQSSPPHQTRPAPKKWNYLYDEALKEMASLGIERKKLSESDFWRQLRDRVCQIRNNYWRRTLEGFMEQILNRLGDRELPFHLAHGDFAPWNTLLAGGQLYLYDWEYTLESAPAGYDLFHFAVQRALLVEGRTPGGVLSAVEETLYQAQDYRQVIDMDDLAWATVFELYLFNQLILENRAQAIKTHLKCLILSLMHKPTFT